MVLDKCRRIIMMKTSAKLPLYSQKTEDLFRSLVKGRRLIAEKEYAHAFNNEREYELVKGYRFRCDDRCFKVLESSTPEKEFLLQPEIQIDKVLLSLAYGDYYYKYEKDWGI
jgi:hypothetical protein